MQRIELHLGENYDASWLLLNSCEPLIVPIAINTVIFFPSDRIMIFFSIAIVHQPDSLGGAENRDIHAISRIYSLVSCIAFSAVAEQGTGYDKWRQLLGASGDD